MHERSNKIKNLFPTSSEFPPQTKGSPNSYVLSGVLKLLSFFHYCLIVLHRGHS